MEKSVNYFKDQYFIFQDCFYLELIKYSQEGKISVQFQRRIEVMLKLKLQMKLKKLLERINFNLLRSLRYWIYHCQKELMRNKMIALISLKKHQRRKKRVSNKKIFSEIKRIYKEMFTLSFSQFSALLQRFRISDLNHIIKYIRKMKKHITQRLERKQKNNKQYSRTKNNLQLSICEKVASPYHEKIGSEKQSLKNCYEEDSRQQQQKQIYTKADKIEGEHKHHNSFNSQQIIINQLTDNSQLLKATFVTQSKYQEQTQIEFTYFWDKQQSFSNGYQKKILQSQISQLHSEKQNFPICNSLYSSSQKNMTNTQSQHASNIFSIQKINNLQGQKQIISLLNQPNKTNENYYFNFVYPLQQSKEPVIIHNYQFSSKNQQKISSNKSKASKLERQQKNHSPQQQEIQSMESNEILLDYLDYIIFVIIHDGIIVISSIDFLNNFSESMDLLPICQKSAQNEQRNNSSSEKSYYIDHFFNRLFYYWQMSFPFKFNFEKPQKTEKNAKQKRCRVQNNRLWRAHIFQRFLLKRNCFNNFLNDSRKKILQNDKQN